MDIYIDDLRLPVLPASYTVTDKQNNKRETVVQAGELNLFGTRGLRELGFSSFFPFSSEAGGYTRHGSHREPFALVNKIVKKKESGPVRVIITETNINEEFLIEDFKFEQNDATGDVSYEISFSEYVRPRVAVKNGSESALYESRQTRTTAADTYTVRPGDTIKSVAKSQTGKAANWEQIATLNHLKAPYTITSGQVLIVS
ncbi:MAG: LysM peptidoglycan-binding domain-containing protein [Clostridia bacterium]|nr:LysM peptidoglycan-binding domain-containing protein [Clostridia bacterium]